MSFSLQHCRVQPVLATTNLPLDVLRLDLIHPTVSGNKWFKLKEYLHTAKQTGKSILVTFGGAYSNHIVATAAAAREDGFQSVGLIRGEQPATYSPTLVAAQDYGMQLVFVSRHDYRQKLIPPQIHSQFSPAELFVIPEGGYGPLGKTGARDILFSFPTQAYTHIVVAVGTGTTLAGLADAALPHQKIIGIPVLKNAFSLQQEIEQLLSPEKKATFQLVHDYHFGGYAKQTPALIAFMNRFFQTTAIPTDFVYTGKSVYAIFDLYKNGFFTDSDRVLFVHTGGLQGNLSLPKGTLIFG